MIYETKPVKNVYKIYLFKLIFSINHLKSKLIIKNLLRKYLFYRISLLIASNIIHQHDIYIYV